MIKKIQYLWNKKDRIEDIICPFCCTKGKYDYLQHVDDKIFKYQVTCECCGLGGPLAEGLVEGTAKKNAVFEMLNFIKMLKR